MLNDLALVSRRSFRYLWPVINNVHLKQNRKGIFIYSEINEIMSTGLAISSDLDFSAPRSSLHLIDIHLRHMCGLQHYENV